MREAAAELDEEIDDPEVRIRVRIAIDCGEAFADEAAAVEGRIAADVFNTAARLQAAALPGDVLVSAAAEPMLRGRVELEPLGAIELKGKAEPVHAHRVLELRPTPVRIETPLVGRERHLRVLNEALEDAIDARACVLATVLAPPGVGKSRLATSFADCGSRTGDGPRRSDSLLRRRRHVRAARRAALPSGRLPGGDAESVAAALRERMARQARRSGGGGPHRPGPRCRRGARVRRVLGGPAPARGHRLRTARSSSCSRTCTGRSRRCSTWPTRSSSDVHGPVLVPVPREARAPRAAPHLGGREAARDHRRPFPRSRRRTPGASRRASARATRHPQPSSTRVPRRPRGTRCTWSSSRRCSRTRGSSWTAGGWAPKMPRSRSPRPCRRCWPRGSIGSIACRVLSSSEPPSRAAGSGPAALRALAPEVSPDEVEACDRLARKEGSRPARGRGDRSVALRARARLRGCVPGPVEGAASRSARAARRLDDRGGRRPGRRRRVGRPAPRARAASARGAGPAR